MFKIKRLLLNFIIMFLVCNNNVYATTNGNYVVESNQSGIEKLIFLLIAIGLVAAVLFLGYKMDQNEEKKNYKTIVKNNNLLKQTNKKIKEESKNPYKLEINESEFNDETIKEETYENELIDSLIEEGTIEFSKMLDIDENIEDFILQEEIQNQDIDDEIKINIDETLIDAKELSVEISEEDDTKKNNTEILENENIKEIDEKDEFEDSDESEEIEQIQEMKENSNLNVFTKVLNSFGSKENNSANDKQDFEEDLLDIKQLIADANIKRYTRKINRNENEVDIEKEINKQESKVKRYTRKIMRQETNKNEYELQSSEELVQKSKRGRPRKQDMQKPKRGRPKKVEQKKRGRPKKVEPKRRGRPRKEDTEKPKRGRPRKNS